MVIEMDTQWESFVIKSFYTYLHVAVHHKYFAEQAAIEHDLKLKTAKKQAGAVKIGERKYHRIGFYFSPLQSTGNATKKRSDRLTRKKQMQPQWDSVFKAKKDSCLKLLIPLP